MIVNNASRSRPARRLVAPRPAYYSIKRVVDLMLCIALLPVLLVLMAIISIAIRLDSPGSPIFIQERIGKAGRAFRIYKFRTMRRDHDSQTDQAFMQAYIAGQPIHSADQPEHTVYKPSNDHHYTRLGKYLRKSSLDELPQIFNVLIGEMSLIGPRPNVPWEVNTYNPWHMERLTVLPGITGLAQVRGRSSIAFDTLVRYDIHYVRNYSMILDIKIVWWTVLGLILGKGAR